MENNNKMPKTKTEIKSNNDFKKFTTETLEPLVAIQTKKNNNKDTKQNLLSFLKKTYNKIINFIIDKRLDNLYRKKQFNKYYKLLSKRYPSLGRTLDIIYRVELVSTIPLLKEELRQKSENVYANKTNEKELIKEREELKKKIEQLENLNVNNL